MIFSIGFVLFVIGLIWNSTLHFWDDEWKIITASCLLIVGFMCMCASLGILAIQYLP